MATKVFTYKFAVPGPAFSESNDSKFNWGNEPATAVDLKDYPEGHEVLGVEIFVDDRMFEGLNAAFKFFNDDTGELLFEGSHTRPSPQSQNWEWWNWQRIRAWIGHVGHEIKGPMLIRAEVDTRGQKFIRKIRVVDSTQPPEVPLPPPQCAVPGIEPTFPIPPVSFDPETTTVLWNFKMCQPETLTVKNLGGELAGEDFTAGFKQWTIRKRDKTEVLIDPKEVMEITFIDIITEPPPDEPPGPEKKWWEQILSFDDNGALHIGPAIVGVEKLQTWLEDNVYGEKASPIVKGIFYTALGAAGVAVLIKLILRFTATRSATLLSEAAEHQAFRNAWSETSSSQLLREAAANEAFWGGWKATAADQFRRGVFTIPKGIEAFMRFEFQTAKNAIVTKRIADTAGPVLGKQVFEKAGHSKLWTVIPQNWKWWLGGLTGLMGFGLFSDWIAKESVWESTSFPITDLIRAREFELAATVLPRAEAALVFYENVVNTVGWLNPISNIIFKKGIEEARANIELWRKQIELNLPITVPPVPPPGEEPPETPPGEETPDPVNVPTEGKSFITLVSAPEGANIWIDGENTFTQTPFAHLLDSGTHNIQLSLFKHTPTFETVTLEPGKSIIKTYTLEALSPTEPESPFIPVPIEVPLERPEPVVIKPNAWEYTITARDGSTQQILNAKIIVDGIFTGKYTTNSIILEPDASYLLRLEAFGYEPGEVTINTEALPD